MDIRAEKLLLIEWLVRLNDAKVIQELTTLRKETEKDIFKSYSDEDMILRAEASLSDIELGRSKSMLEFKSDFESWKKSRNTR